MSTLFDVERLYVLLDARRRAAHLHWRDIATATGVSASTGRGHRTTGPGLCATAERKLAESDETAAWWMKISRNTAARSAERLARAEQLQGVVDGIRVITDGIRPDAALAKPEMRLTLIRHVLGAAPATQPHQGHGEPK